MQEVIMIIGLPCVGKTTYCQEHYSNYKFISRDTYREELTGSSTNFSAEEKVTALAKKNFLKYLNNGNNIVIDNTNLKREYREFFYLLINKEIKLTVLNFDLGSREHLRRINQRSFPITVIQSMHLGMEEFIESEISDFPLIKELEVKEIEE